ncbi:MAG: Rdx family protein [Deltaproteobacteria bacterium]|nr:Rdx family protein [Deltaproteobacteria bacterium]
MPQASSLLAALKEKFGVKAKLIAGGGGIFEVSLDGKVVFDKFSMGRFPENQEVVDQINAIIK